MTRKIFLAVFVLVCAIALPLYTALAAPNFKPGKWEITTTTEMVGMGDMQVPSVTHVQCLKKGALVPQSEEAARECKITDIREKGNTVFWKIICSGQDGAMTGTGKVSYNGETMEGTMDMVIQGAGMKIKNTISGRRIGPCD